MLEKAKRYGIKEYLRKFIMGFQLISSLALGIFIAGVLYFSLKYFDVPLYTDEQVKEAQKTGNWEFPDANYVLKNFEAVSIANKNIGMVAVKDKKSGNMMMVFDIPFSREEVLKTKDDIQNKLLEKYNLGGSFLESSGNKTGRIGEEFVYSVVGWNSASGAETGIIGSLDCIKNRKSGSNIIAVVENSSAKYSEERALGFINTLKCPVVSDIGGGDSQPGDKIDTDNDGLPDIVEKMLGTNPYNSDTNGDGISDFNEIKTGHNPLKPSPWNAYTPEEFAKVKKDIKYISPDTYNKLWGRN